MPMSWHTLGILVGLGLAAAALATTSSAHESRNTTAPQAMATMMEMARRMGHGDVMVGMTRMMKMMDGMSGMMGGQGGTMPHEPGK